MLLTYLHYLSPASSLLSLVSCLLSPVSCLLGSTYISHALSLSLSLYLGLFAPTRSLHLHAGIWVVCRHIICQYMWYIHIL
ncbi:hypothetical protein F5Y12DRAFT_775875 [Xylaria sp. FL1777]|nr:hypothetical protein F5Y12DRAFT_775875 [Xylaria sp. FL1777]